MQLLDGKLISEQIKAEIAQEVLLIKENNRKVPHLAAVLIGENPASKAYVGSKVRSCAQIGFDSTLIQKPETITEAELIAVIEDLNNNPEIDGFIVQLPLPKHINEDKITMAIRPEKDVDGFHPINIGRMTIGMPAYLPATPYGILLC